MRSPDSTDETKIYELIEKVTVVNVHQDCLESCHLLTSSKKKKIIDKFSRQKNAESVLQNKNKFKNFNPWSIDNDSNNVFINGSLCRYYKFLWSKCKNLWTEKWIEAFLVSNGKIKLRIEPEEAVSRISLVQDLQKLLPDYKFQSD